VHLGLDHGASAQLLRRSGRLGRARRDVSLRHGHAVSGQELLGLVFM